MSVATKLYTLKVGQRFLMRESSPNDDKVRFGVYLLELAYGTAWKCSDQNGEVCYIDLDTEVTALEE